MRTILRSAIRRSQRRENYLMERRIYAQESETEEAKDKEDKIEEAKDKED